MLLQNLGYLCWGSDSSTGTIRHCTDTAALAGHEALQLAEDVLLSPGLFVRITLGLPP